MRVLSSVMPPLYADAPPTNGIVEGVEVARLKSNNSGRSLTIHAFELLGLIMICRALKAPAQKSKLATEFGGAGGQPAGIVPVVITSIAGESAATAPVPLGMALIRVGLFAVRGGACTSVWSQVANT